MPSQSLEEFLVSIPPSHIRRPRAEESIRQIGNWVLQYPERDHLTPAQKATLQKALTTLTTLTNAFGQSDTSKMVRSTILGKLGEVDAAVMKADAEFRRKPTWKSAITLANALRRKGDIPAALEALESAATLDPKDVSAFLDMGDIHLDAMDWPRALDAYEHALVREPQQAWAEPSFFYCRFRLRGDTADLERLRQQAAVPKDKCGVQSILSQVTGSYTDDARRERSRFLLDQLKK